jgi:hypothetical protein
MRRTALALLACAALGGCRVTATADDDYVYLRVQHDFSKSSCTNRLSFQRIGADGQVAGPQDANGNFTIPSGRSLVVTDVHVLFTGAPAAAQQSVSLYIQTTGRGVETPVWFPVVNAPAGGSALYDRALSTGIRVAAGSQVCTAFKDQTHETDVVLTGYLQ